jgi:hypothetical protein
VDHGDDRWFVVVHGVCEIGGIANEYEAICILHLFSHIGDIPDVIACEELHVELHRDHCELLSHNHFGWSAELLSPRRNTTTLAPLWQFPARITQMLQTLSVSSSASAPFVRVRFSSRGGRHGVPVITKASATLQDIETKLFCYERLATDMNSP